MEKYLRKLARSHRWQLLYAKSKEVNGIQIFENNTNFSHIQLRFLYWLSIYNSLYQDLAMKEKYLTREVINSDIECDAYLYYQSVKKPEKVKQETNKPQNTTGLMSLVQKKKR